MIGPSCAICGTWGGSYVQFAVTDKDEIAYNRQFEIGFQDIIPAGHPYGNRCFCDEHLGLAWKYQRLTWDEARPLIMKDFENKEIAKLPIYRRLLCYLFRKSGSNKDK
jgi:hypothetical protein